jgi:60 kDa SS-A/Ro ribonucleoprotein
VTNYAEHVSKKVTPQSEAALPGQAENNARAFSFVVDDWERLTRFLILGAEGGTYYAKERALTKENAACIERCLDADPERTVAIIAELSMAGCAPKNDPAVFALALAAAHQNPVARRAALAELPRVCRIGTHLFQFVEACSHLRGFGTGLRRAVGNWYSNMPADKLAYQALKYQQRGGWSHRDVLRQAHARSETFETEAVLRWIVAGSGGLDERTITRKASGKSVTYPSVVEHLPKLLSGYELIKKADSPARAAKLIREYRFTHEMVPTEFKNDPGVWEALLENMPIGAMVRSLGKMSAVGLLAPLSNASKVVIERLGEAERIRKARLHPISVLTALRTYAQGRGVRGKLSWAPVQNVVDALDSAFYLAFDAVEPTGARTMLAIDVSGSMSGGCIAGIFDLTPRIAAAAMAMVTARVEKSWHAVGFTAHGFKYGEGRSLWGSGYPSCVSELRISPTQRLDAVVKTMESMDMGGTDCALPMIYATEMKLQVDAFHVYTDNETWAGDIHPHQALERYRQASGINAKLVVVGMTGTEFSIANPNDAGMLDVVGFDAAAPAVMADFVRVAPRAGEHPEHPEEETSEAD